MINPKIRACGLASFAVAVALFASLPLQAQYVGPAAGQKVAFMGDSITQFGEGPTGYVSLIADALEQQGKKIEVIPAGVSGNTSKDMLARLDKDVLSKKPDWMTLSCGVNDVWHGMNGVPLDQYQQNITSIVDQATAAGIKVVILTSTMITEDQAAPFNQKLIAYNDFLHTLATQKHLLVADLNADMQAALAQQKAAMPTLKGIVLTIDGVHMNGLGNEMMAAGVLKAFGCTDAQVDQAREAWMDLPGASGLIARTTVSVRQYLKLRELATAQGHTVDELLGDALNKDVQTLLTAASPANSAPATPPAKP
jgi:lysophospholipase L1-like esterase